MVYRYDSGLVNLWVGTRSSACSVNCTTFKNYFLNILHNTFLFARGDLSQRFISFIIFLRIGEASIAILIFKSKDVSSRPPEGYFQVSSGLFTF